MVSQVIFKDMVEDVDDTATCDNQLQQGIDREVLISHWAPLNRKHKGSIQP